MAKPQQPIPLCACDEAPASLWWRIGGGAFLAMNGMVLSIALNGSETNVQERYALQLSILCITLPVFLLLSGEFFQATWRALRQRQLSIEFLFLVGIVASLSGSILFLFRGEGSEYADIASMLIVIYALGRQIGAYGKQRVLNSLSDWAPQNRRARRLTAAGEEMVPAADLQAGDRVRVLPGECVAADLTMTSSGALVHEASITGESLAVRKQHGDLVRAGSFPLDASLDGEATGAGGGSEIDQVKTLIEAGLARPGVEQKLAMDALRWFVPLVVAATVTTFFIHLIWHPWHEAIFTALAVAVVACPCGLGFATPLAVWTGIGRLRELGIVARSGDSVEKLSEVDVVVFDKTGTLTLPEEYGVRWTVAESWQKQGREDELRARLRDAEESSRHPLARVLAPLWKDAPPSPSRLAKVGLLPGRGIEASFEDGLTLFAGANDRDAGHLVIEVNGQPAASIELEEKQVPELSPAIQALENLGIEIVLATGDSAERAAAIPAPTRLARRTPTDKHDLIRGLHEQGRKVLFAGDGLNDSAAMAWSHVACAAPDSVELVQDVCSLIFLHRDWRKLAEAIQIARKVRDVVRWNIRFSLAYNFLGIALGMLGWLHPVASALLMTASSLTVIIYSMHLMDWEASDDESGVDHAVRSRATGNPVQPIALG